MALPALLAAALLTLPALAPVTPIDLPPVVPPHVLVPFRAPADTYAPGHRGVDLAASPGQPVRAPITGVVTFVGTVAGRPVVVIGDGRRSVTLEPVAATVTAGMVVGAGAPIGSVANGGHCDRHCVHVGMRVGGTYVDPLRLRVRLVP